MGKTSRVVVAGARESGKTAILHQLALCTDISDQAYEPTLDDTYTVTVEGEKGGRDSLVLHDTPGLAPDGPLDLRRSYLLLADAFVLVYDVGDMESFNRLDHLKKSIDRHLAKEKKDLPIFVLGNKADRAQHSVPKDFASAWATRERVSHYQVSAKDRQTLVEPVVALSFRLFHPQKESKFTLPKRGKEKPGAAILMDI